MEREEWGERDGEREGGIGRGRVGGEWVEGGGRWGERESQAMIEGKRQRGNDRGEGDRDGEIEMGRERKLWKEKKGEERRGRKRGENEMLRERQKKGRDREKSEREVDGGEK